ncbi:MAG TPA: sigma-70 family RNA polymerase sigma factor [Vicinamibacterales bacterium]
MDPDRALVEAAAGGSRDAFDELVRRHQAAMIRLARVLTSGRGDAEDLAQDVFVRAWRSLRSFRGESTFRTWLHRVAINVIRTSQSRQGRLMRVFVSRDREDPPPDPASGEEPVDATLARRQVIDRALAALPDDLRVAVTLRDMQGLDYKEIAAALDVPIGTVESRIFRARQRLKPLLEMLMRP